MPSYQIRQKKGGTPGGNRTHDLLCHTILPTEALFCLTLPCVPQEHKGKIRFLRSRDQDQILKSPISRITKIGTPLATSAGDDPPPPFSACQSLGQRSEYRAGGRDTNRGQKGPVSALLLKGTPCLWVNFQLVLHKMLSLVNKITC